MRIKAFAVIDTNVIISSMISKQGFTDEIINLVKSGNIIPIFDKRMLNEYYTVSHYEKFQSKTFNMPLFDEKNIYDVLYEIVNNGLFINNVEKTKEAFIDNTDIPFFEVKMSSEELDTHLITGNTKHFPKIDTIVSPKEMIRIMKYLDRFLSNDIDFDKNINKIINSSIETGKYTPGIELLNKMFDENTKTIKQEYFR